VRKTIALGATLLLAAITALHLPTPTRLELYAANDLVYDLGGGFPGVDISLATEVLLDPIVDVDLMMTGSDLAESLQLLVPGIGEDRTVGFQNGLLIVRATAIQHAAIQTALIGYRARNAGVSWIISRLTHAKAALSAALFGMITK
jgi:hypothetical protein